MTTPMQKAARAAFDADCVQHDQAWRDMEWESDLETRELYTTLARAVLATLLPPSPEMIEAGFRAEQDAAEKANTDHLPLSQRDFLAVAFTVMINAGCE